MGLPKVGQNCKPQHFGILLNIIVNLSIRISKSPPSASPKPLVATVKRYTQEMTSTEIEEIIKTELQVEKDLKNVFGLDLTKCLIKPTRQKYKNANDSTDIYELWTVLEENEDGNGYKIYFDEDSKTFGLAIKSDKDELIDIGGYGSFLKTLYSM